MAAATTSMVVLAFVVPLGLLVRDMASERAMSKATLEAQSLVSVLTAVDPSARSGVVDARFDKIRQQSRRNLTIEPRGARVPTHARLVFVYLNRHADGESPCG